MPTYPLTFPSIGVKNSTFRLRRIVGESSSPFTGQQQLYRYPGEYWEGEITFRPAKRADARLIQAFLAELRGKSGTFLYGDPDAIQQGVMGVGGAILVNGSGQTGNSLVVDGMTPSTANILKAGDYFQLGTGANARLHMVTQPLDSNASGQGTVYFEPALRSSPADNLAFILAAPMTVMRSIDNVAEWSSAEDMVVNGITVAFREAL